jgi:hypothetical protein
MIRFCPECGTRRVEDAPFCEQCGHAFGAAEPSVATEAPGPAVAADETADAGPARAGVSKVATEPGRRRLPRRRTMAIGAAAAALAVAGVGAWWTGMIEMPGSEQAGSADLDLALMPIAFGERCGFVDSTGRMVINPQFDSAAFFSRTTGLAPVMMGGKWGLIDREGDFVVNPQYDGIIPIHGESSFVVRIGDRFGIVDSSGAFVVNPQFDAIGGFDSDGRALAGTGGRHGLIDRRGNFVVPPQFDEIASDTRPNGDVRYFVSGLAAARSGDRWGFIDGSGNWVVTPQFASALAFDDDGLAAVQVMSGPAQAADQPQPGTPSPAATASTDPVAPAGPNGAVPPPPPPPPGPPRTVTIPGGETAVLPPNIDVPLDPSGNLIMNTGDSITVSNGVVTGFTPGPGTVLPSSSGSAPKTQPAGNWGYVDRRGRLVIQPRFASAGGFSGAGLAPVQLEGRFGYVDRTGTMRINPQFGAARDFVQGPGGWIAAVAVDPEPGQTGESRRRWGLIGQNGSFRAQPQFDHLEDFDANGRSVARVGENVGLIDETGRFVVAPTFNSLILLPGARNYLYTRSGGVTTGANVLEIGWIDSGGRVLSTARGAMCGMGTPV